MRVTLGGVRDTRAQAGLWVGNALVEKVGRISGEGVLEPVTTSYPIRLIVHWAGSATEGEAQRARCRLLSDAIVVHEGDSSVVVTDEEEALARIGRRAKARVMRFRTAGYVVDGTQESEDSSAGCLAPGSIARFTIGLPHDHPLHPDVHSAHPQHDNLGAGYRAELDPGVESRALVRTMTLKVGAEDDAAGHWWSESRIEGLYTEEITGAVRIGAEAPPVLRVAGRFILTRVSTARLETGR